MVRWSSTLLRVLLFSSISHPRPCPWLSHSPPPFRLLPYPELNSQRKTVDEGRACCAPVEIRREKRASTNSARREISNVTCCAFLIKPLYHASPHKERPVNFIFLIYTERKFSSLIPHRPFTFCVFALRLSLHPRAFGYWRDVCPFSPLFRVSRLNLEPYEVASRRTELSKIFHQKAAYRITMNKFNHIVIYSSFYRDL